MGRPKPGADISIGNLRRIPETQTEAEDHKMQDNKGRTKRLREGISESIRIETGRRGEREIDFRACKQQRLKSRCALACSLGVTLVGVPLSKTFFC